MLTLQSDALKIIVDDCFARAPREACGIVAKDGMVHSLANASWQPQHAYEFHPDEQRIAWQAMADRDTDLLCIWHSHPTGPSQASGTDRATAWFPGAYYLVLNLSPEPDDIPAVPGMFSAKAYLCTEMGVLEETELRCAG